MKFYLSDPVGIKIRPVKGRQGAAYLAPGVFTNSLSYVFGPLIKELIDLGYNEDNLLAMTYE
jgi:hypothetical protein